MKHGVLQTLIHLRMDLLKAAKKQITVPYKTLMTKHGILRGTRFGQGIGWMVGYVSEYEYEHGRPLLSAIVVRSGNASKQLPYGHPGKGFLRIDGVPAHLQRGSRDNRPLNTAEKAFILNAQQRVWNYWKRNRLPTKRLNDLLNR
jgi:hypothetical protein